MVDPTRHVTVGMPVYNDPEGLRTSVPTVFGQTWDGPVRLLLVDDGSDRETLEVIDELAGAYEAIDVVRNPVNRGRPFVRNQILEHAHGEHLAWLDAGDLWHPRKLEVQMAALEADDGDGPLICVSPLRRYFVDRGVGSVRVPDVGGDQLLGALTGRLFGYLPTMLGRTSAFTDLGFDERLLRRQDYDFLVRFLAEGGRVISTPPDLPLFTYLKSDVGASAETVARANEVIRAKHRPYYARYDAAVAREVARNQHRLVARFHEANGDRVQAARYRARARLADPPAPRNVVRALARPSLPARLRTRLRRRRRGSLASRVQRSRLVAVARRLGLVGLARRMGITGVVFALLRLLTGRSAPGDRAPAPGPAPAEDPLATVRRDAEDRMRTGDPAGAADDLERHLSASPPGDPSTWLVLEEAHRRAGRLHSAGEALERGLAAHPEDRALRLRLSELHGLRREWEACLRIWSALRAEGEDDLTAISFVRVARGLRALEQPERSLEVVLAGLERFPDDRRLDDELRQSRALTVDWARAVRPAGSLAPGSAVGEITDLGFLAGGAGPVEGRVESGAEQAPRVTLELDGRPVASTYASATGDGAARFSLNCRDVLEYVGDGDVITLTSDDRPVATPGGDARFELAPGHASRADELFAKLDAGQVFMKFGRLDVGNTRGRKRAILATYDEVAAVLDDEHGLTLYPIYGNLLGAVRDHDFIEHDVGGFDVTYISGHATPAEVRGEFAAVCRTLAARGYHVELQPWGAFVKRARGDRAFVDLHFAWFTPDGELNVSYGWRHAPVTDREGVLRRRTCPVAGHLVPVPGNAEAVLEQLYGPDWAIPIQGFDPDAGITRDDAYLLSRDEMERLEAADPDRVRVRLVLTDDGEVAADG